MNWKRILANAVASFGYTTISVLIVVRVITASILSGLLSGFLAMCVAFFVLSRGKKGRGSPAMTVDKPRIRVKKRESLYSKHFLFA